MRLPLTPKQKRVLDAIRLYVKTRATTPSVRDLAGLTQSAVGTVHQHLHTLVRKGWIVVDGTSHGIQLLTKGSDVTILVEVPVIGALVSEGRFTAHTGTVETVHLPSSLVGERAFAVRAVGNAYIAVAILAGDLLVFQSTSHFRDSDVVLADNPSTGAALMRVRVAGSSLRLLPIVGSGSLVTAPTNGTRGRLTMLLRRYSP